MNDDAWHTILFVSSQITLYTLGIALTVTERKNAFARQVSLAAIAVIWIVTLGLDAGTASIKPTKSRFYDVHMASAAFHMVFAFAVTVCAVRPHSCGAQTHRPSVAGPSLRVRQRQVCELWKLRQGAEPVKGLLLKRSLRPVHTVYMALPATAEMQ